MKAIQFNSGGKRNKKFSTLFQKYFLGIKRDCQNEDSVQYYFSVVVIAIETMTGNMSIDPMVNSILFQLNYWSHQIKPIAELRML